MERIPPEEYRKLKAMRYKGDARWKRACAWALVLLAEGLSYRAVSILLSIRESDIQAIEAAYREKGLGIFQGDPPFLGWKTERAIRFVKELLKSPPPYAERWTPLEIERRLEMAGLGDELDRPLIARLCRSARA